MFDATRNSAAAVSQTVQSHFAQKMQRIRMVSATVREPSETRSFSISVPPGLNRRKIYALMDCQTVKDNATFYWWMKSTVTALSRGIELQSWPLEEGMFNDGWSSFVDFASSAFPRGWESVSDGLRVMCKNTMSHISMPVILHPLAVSLDCDEIRWDFRAINPPYLDQYVLQARVFIACRSEL